MSASSPALAPEPISTAAEGGVHSGGFLGVEGQLFFNDITIYAQAAALDISNHSDDTA